MNKIVNEIVEEIRLLMKNIENRLNDKEGYWTLRGFIDIAKNIYSLSSDTKLISKALEIMVIPIITDYLLNKKFKVILSPEQNFYPDISILIDDIKIALDIKTSYRQASSNEISGFTLGAFTGYFRNRDSSKSIVFKYNEYINHYILGIIYTDIFKNIKEKDNLDLEEQQEWLIPRISNVDNIENLKPPIRDIEIILYEKWCLSSDSPGSGNTKNIGSIKNIKKVREGKGIFTIFGEDGNSLFDDYWMYYLTIDMARKAQLAKPLYRNLREYLEYRGKHHLIEKLDKYI